MRTAGLLTAVTLALAGCSPRERTPVALEVRRLADEITAKTGGLPTREHVDGVMRVVLPGLVGVIDIAPTVLDLLGLPVPADITGAILAPQLRAGGDPPPLPERALFSENTLHDIYRLAIRWPRWKAMWDGADLKIVDLTRDPTERVLDVSGSQTPQAAAVRAQFEADCRRQRAPLEAAGAAQAAPPPPLPDPDRKRQLKALGYVE